MLKIAIVSPAYNEKKQIPTFVNEYKKFKNKLTNYKCDLIIVDDGSSDDTQSLKELADCIYIKHMVNLGAGGATRTGLNYAKNNNYNLIATIDSDGQHDFLDLKNLIEKYGNKKNTLIIGSRLIDTTGMPGYKIFGNKLLNILSFIILGIKVTDSQSGLKVFDKIALSKLNYSSNDYAFCSEIIWRLQQEKVCIEEYPIKAIYTEYSMNKGGQRSFSGFISILKALLLHRFNGLFNND